MNSRTKQVAFSDLGIIKYKDGWALQEVLFGETIAQKTALRNHPLPENHPTSHLLFCEHPPVYTLGKNGKPENLVLTEAELLKKQIDYHHINRGGDITFHGPGQIVGYPILDLDQFFTDIHRYLRVLEEAVILTLKDYGIISDRVPGLTGVWIDGANEISARKICALGIKCSRWVTMHGFAFNVNTNLDYFNYIIPCGINDKGVTSMQKELDKPVDMSEVKQKLQSHLTQLFGWELIS